MNIIRWDRMKCLPTPTDLTETAVLDAARHFEEFGDSPQYIMCTQSQAVEVSFLAKEFGLKTLTLPDAIIRQDAWCIFGKHSMIWSPGA